MPPTGVPFTVTWAISRTAPRAISGFAPGWDAAAGTGKSFTPASLDFVHDIRLSNPASAGAPRLGWNRTAHGSRAVASGPDIVASTVRVQISGSRDATDVGRRKTTKVE